MKILKFSCYFIIPLVFSFCRKKELPNPIQISHQTSDVVCYPSDSTSLRLVLQITGGTEPYSVIWDQNVVNGSRDLYLKFKTIMTYNLLISDSKNQIKKYSFTLKRSDYDSLKYDYRKPVFGNYDCIRYLTMPSTGGAAYTCCATPDTIHIGASSSFNKLNIFYSTESYSVDVNYNYLNKTITGIVTPYFPNNTTSYWYEGSFVGEDSLKFTYKTIGGYPNFHYRCKKYN